MHVSIELPTKDYAGYIFDMDGTLVDTMPIHYRAWDQAMRMNGMPGVLSEDLFYSLGGVPTIKVAEIMGAHYGLTYDPLKVFHEKETLFVEMLGGTIDLVEPVASFAKKMFGVRPISIASGGPREVVHHTLEHSKLKPFFPVIVSADDVVHGKPAPDMFLLAAKLMGVDPSQCLVFEDAEPGIRGAQAAGMDVIRIPSRPSRPA